MKNLNYFYCNIDIIILLCIILPTMFFTIIFMKLFILGEIYKHHHSCWPISYYFGEKKGCQRTINQSVETIKENFDSLHSTRFHHSIAKINKSFSENILFMNQSILKFLFHFFSEIF